LTPQTADGRKPANERKLRSLIADAQAAEESYLRTFGIYPINHVVVIRSEVLQRLPGLPLVLFEAYEETKARAYAPPIRYDIDAVACTALEENLRPVRRGFAVPYGFNDLNRTVVGTLARFLHEQKLIERPPDLQKLFLSV
jgi:4,5-dihydroxyphthalate decarboxylase